MTTTADSLRFMGHRETLLLQLEVKFGQVDPAIRAKVEKASPEQVITWTRRIVVVDSLEEVFAD